MTKFVRKDLGVQFFDADVTTGEQVAITPWGNMVARAGDVLVPYGNKVVLVPLGLLMAWFAIGNGVDEVEEEEPIVRLEPDRPAWWEDGRPAWWQRLAQELDRQPTAEDLNSYAEREHGRKLDRRRKDEALIMQISTLEDIKRDSLTG